MKEKWFTFHWIGKDAPSYHKGTGPADAARKAGYGAGAIKALDWTEESKVLPLEYKEIVYIENGKREFVADGGFVQKNLLKELQLVNADIKHHELVINVMGHEVSVDVEIRKFEISTIVTSVVKRDGERVQYKFDSDNGLYGFKYDHEDGKYGKWKVVADSSGDASPVVGTFPGWREAQIYTASLNDVEESQTMVCIDDHQPFPLSMEQATWFIQRGLQTPKRCPICRDRKKEEKMLDEKMEFNTAANEVSGLLENYIARFGNKWPYIRKVQRFINSTA